MSEFLKNELVSFVIHLTAGNPYQATADYLATLLMPCPLPSWSVYLQRVIIVPFSIMLLQSIYVLYVRSKSKKLYHIGLNDMGLIQLDRANHCGLCYFLYSIIAIIEIICEEFARSGHLDQAWPNFVLGIKFTLTIACAIVILWLSICHCALFKQRNVAQGMVPVGQLLPTTVTWTLNIFLVIIIVVPAVAIFFPFFQLTMEYRRVKQMVVPIIKNLRQNVSKCSRVKCSVADVIPQIIPLAKVDHHLDLVVTYTRIGMDFYVLFSGILLLIYIPFLCLLFQNFYYQRGVALSTKRQQKGVFANTLLEFTIILSLVVLIGSAIRLIHNGDFIVNPNFWLLPRIGINISISILGNIALFLILYSIRKANVTPPKALVGTPKFMLRMRDTKSGDTASLESPHQPALELGARSLA